MVSKYVPPKQSGWGQAFDCIFVLALVYVCLLLPLLIGGGASTYTVPDAKANPTWESLHQNPTMVQQWKKLDMSPKEAGKLINTRFDYDFSWLALAVTAVVIIGYFFILLVMSKKEYKDVINEAFGERR